MGLNVRPEAVPPADELLFPAISVEEALGQPVDRLPLLRNILRAMFTWRERIKSSDFREAWQDRLAFREEWVQIEESGANRAPVVGQVTGLDKNGNLAAATSTGGLTGQHEGRIGASPLIGCWT